MRCCEVPASHRRYGDPEPCDDAVEFEGCDLERLYCACGHTGTCHLAARVESGRPAERVAMLYWYTSPRGRRAWLTRYGERQELPPAQWRLWLALATGVLYVATGAADAFIALGRAKRSRHRV